MEAPAYELRPIGRALAETLGAAIAGMEPWSVVEYPASRITAFLIGDDPALNRFAVMVGNEPAGVVCVRQPWLHGPYLQLLGLLPPFQSKGLGSKLLVWFEQQAVPAERWLWLCCSSFNTRALGFYEARGYEQVTTLTDLVKDGGTEILMRKRNAHPPA